MKIYKVTNLDIDAQEAAEQGIRRVWWLTTERHVNTVRKQMHSSSCDILEFPKNKADVVDWLNDNVRT